MSLRELKEPRLPCEADYILWCWSVDSTYRSREGSATKSHRHRSAARLNGVSLRIHSVPAILAMEELIFRGYNYADSMVYR